MSSYPFANSGGYYNTVRCTCDSGGSPPKKMTKRGKGYKHYSSDLMPHRSLIESLQRARNLKHSQAILTTAPGSFIRFISHLTKGLVSGALRVSSSQIKRLIPYRGKLIKFSKLRNIKQLRRRACTGGKTQKGGILPIIPFLISLGPLLAKGLAVGVASAAAGAVTKTVIDKIKGNESAPQTGSGTFRRKGKSPYYYH